MCDVFLARLRNSYDCDYLAMRDEEGVLHKDKVRVEQPIEILDFIG